MSERLNPEDAAEHLQRIHNFEAVPVEDVCLHCPNPVSRFGKECSECLEKRAEVERRQTLDRVLLKLPDVLRRARFDNPNLHNLVGTENVEIARAWLEKLVTKPTGFNHSITFTGPARKGKTTLACALMGELIDLGMQRKHFARASRIEFFLANDLAAARDESRLGAPVRIVERSIDASVLLLDEVGRIVRRPNDDTIFRVVHLRHRECRPTIFTTPARTEKEMLEMCGDAGFTSRVFGDAKVVHL